MTFALDAFVNRLIHSDSPIRIVSNDTCSQTGSSEVRGNKPIIDVKRHQYFGHLVANSVLCNVCVKSLTNPLPVYGIGTHIKHERGECSPLGNTLLGIKRLPIITPGMAHQFCCVPEMLLEAQHPWPDSIGCQNIKLLLPIKRIVCLLQIYMYLIEWALIAPG
jgi:hypothetical protein